MFAKAHLLLASICIACSGCRSDGTITAFHPQKPVTIVSQKCPKSPILQCRIDDSAVPLSVGRGETMGTIHGEVFLAEQISTTLTDKLNCLALTEANKVSRIKHIKIKRLVLGYRNVGVAWLVESSLEVETTFSDETAIAFTASDSIPSLTFTISKNCSTSLENIVDKYIASIRHLQKSVQ